MIACLSCTSDACWLQASTERRGQLKCPQCWRYFVFVAAQLVELDEATSQGFESLDPNVSMFKRRNLLIWGGIADPWHDRRDADLRELEQIRAGRPPAGGAVLRLTGDGKNEDGRRLRLDEYESDFADALFPPKADENFFDRELRSELSEVLLEHCVAGVSFTIEALVDYVRQHTPQSLRDCGPQFRPALEARWRANQTRIIDALRAAQERGLRSVVMRLAGK
jgi:hypothetical protein